MMIEPKKGGRLDQPVMSIRKKIILSLFGIVVVMLGLIFFLIDRMIRIENMTRSITEINFKKVDLTKQLISILENQEDSYNKYSTLRDIRYFESIEEMEKDFKDRLEALRELSSPEEQMILSEIESLYADYLSPLQAGPAPLGRKGRKEFKRDSIVNLKHDLDLLSTLLERDISNKVAKAKADSKNAQKLARAVSAATALLASLIVLIIMRRLSKPLENLEAGTRQLARGDFSYRIKVTGNDELAELATAFNSMASRLGELDKFKRDFLSHISHELKGPLAAIRQVSDLLSDGLVGPINEKQKRLLKISLRNCRKLSTMLNDLLDISKIEAGVMEYRMEEEDLVKVIQACAQEMEPVSYEKSTRISTVFSEPMLVFSFDRLHISQVLNNLLSNAIKFTPAGGMIVVKMDRVESTGLVIPERYNFMCSKFSQAKRGYAMVTVRDTGIGIPPEELDKIFEKFYQIKNGEQVRKGTGLGLAISKSIIEAHDGFIWAENDGRQGSCFKFVLPITSEVSIRTLSISEPRTEIKL